MSDKRVRIRKSNDAYVDLVTGKTNQLKFK